MNKKYPEAPILMTEKRTTRAVERSLDVLLCFLQRSTLSLTEISEITQLHKSTVYRLLATLTEKGFLQRDPETEKYRLGRRIWELSLKLDASDDPAVLFLAEMERLRDKIEETVSLYVRDGAERIRIQAAESQQAIRRVAPVGVRLPVIVGASGKVLMAYSEQATVEPFIQAADWANEAEREQYIAQLAKIVQSGFAISVEEREKGTAAIAVPVLDRGQKLIAALAISGPVQRMEHAQMQQILPEVQAAAARMGRMMRG
jgi:IclR family transcriptional regulator, KDG regulon repressor